MLNFINSYWILIIPVITLIIGLLFLSIGTKNNNKNLIIFSKIISIFSFVIICYLVFVTFMIYLSMKPLN